MHGQAQPTAFAWGTAFRACAPALAGPRAWRFRGSGPAATLPTAADVLAPSAPFRFTAATAAGLTTQQLSGGISSLKDLKGRPVIVWDAYAQEFKFSGINPIPM